MVSVAFGQRTDELVFSVEDVGSNFVGAAQVGYLDSLFAARFPLGRHFSTIDALVADDPGKRPAFLADGLLQ
jgi:hypothetical protein